MTVPIDPLLERIDAALNDAEAMATAATPGPWYLESGGDYGSHFWIIANVLREKYGKNALNFGEDGRTAQHVATWSPSRVLSMIATDRNMIEHRHRPLPTRDEVPFCQWCSFAWPCEDVIELAERWGVEIQQ